MKRFLAFSLIVLVSTVACQRSKQQTGFNDIPDDDGGGSSGYTTPKTKLPQKQPNQLQAAAPAQVTTCFPLASKSMAVYNKCYATVEDSDVASGTCINSLAQLASSLCDGMQNRINTAKSQCGSLFNQYRSQLPSACVSAINAVM